MTNITYDSILNSQEISLLTDLLDYAPHVLSPERATISANVKQKLAQIAVCYHIIQEDGIETSLLSVRFALESAIKEKKVVAFTYTLYDTKYFVEPYRIVQASGIWYLVAMHEGRFNKKLKKFRLDLIEGVEIMDKYFDAPTPELAAKLAIARTIWFSEGPPVKVIVEFDQRVAHFFQRKQFFPAQEIKEVNKDGSIIVLLEAANRMDFFLQAARWMPHFRIIDPPEFRELICERARLAFELNKPLQTKTKSDPAPWILTIARTSVKSLLCSFRLPRIPIRRFP